MVDWMARTREKLAKAAERGTAKTAKTRVSSVLAVPSPTDFRKSSDTDLDASIARDATVDGGQTYKGGVSSVLAVPLQGVFSGEIRENGEKTRQGGTAKTAKTSPSVFEFEERASVLEHDGGLTKTEAERGAAVALGFASPDAFYAAVLASWRACIERVRPASPSIKALKETSLQFIGSPLAMQAVRCGWDELCLFGFLRAPPKPRAIASAQEACCRRSRGHPCS